jgi:hypothetical protein
MELEPLAHPQNHSRQNTLYQEGKFRKSRNSEATGTVRKINQLTWDTLDENLKLQL